MHGFGFHIDLKSQSRTAFWQYSTEAVFLSNHKVQFWISVIWQVFSFGSPYCKMKKSLQIVFTNFFGYTKISRPWPGLIWKGGLGCFFLSNRKVQFWISVIWQVFFFFLDHHTVKWKKICRFFCQIIMEVHWIIMF